MYKINELFMAMRDEKKSAEKNIKILKFSLLYMLKHFLWLTRKAAKRGELLNRIRIERGFHSWDEFLLGKKPIEG